MSSSLTGADARSWQQLEVTTNPIISPPWSPGSPCRCDRDEDGDRQCPAHLIPPLPLILVGKHTDYCPITPVTGTRGQTEGSCGLHTKNNKRERFFPSFLTRCFFFHCNCMYFLRTFFFSSSEQESKSYWFRTTWGCVNEDRIFNFAWITYLI